MMYPNLVTEKRLEYSTSPDIKYARFPPLSLVRTSFLSERERRFERERALSGRSAGSFPEQRLDIKGMVFRTTLENGKERYTHLDNIGTEFAGQLFSCMIQLFLNKLETSEIQKILSQTVLQNKKLNELKRHKFKELILNWKFLTGQHLIVRAAPVTERMYWYDFLPFLA